jgi:hypothetical protein
LVSTPVFGLTLPEHNSHEWKYFVECPNHAMTTWYLGADLALLDEAADEA